MVIKPMLAITIISIVFILLSVALVSDETETNGRMFGRTYIPLSFPTPAITQTCVDTLWGKEIMRRCQ